MKEKVLIQHGILENIAVMITLEISVVVANMG